MPIPKEMVAAMLQFVDSIERQLDLMGWTNQRVEAMPDTFLAQLRRSMLPGIRARFAGAAPLPPDSNLGVMAVREFDGQEEFEPLTQLLSAFDQTYNQVRRLFPD